MPHNPYNLAPATKEDGLGLLGHLPGLGEMPQPRFQGYDPMQKTESGFMVQTPLREEPVPIEYVMDTAPEMLTDAYNLIDPSGEMIPNPLNEPESGAITPLLGPISAADLAIETGLLGLAHTESPYLAPAAALGLGIGGGRGLRGMIPKGIAESKLAGWLERVGPRWRGFKRKYIEGQDRLRYPNETFYPAGEQAKRPPLSLKSVAYGPKSKLKFDPYEELEETWPSLSLSEMEEAIDLPKSYRWPKRGPLSESDELAREVHKAEVARTLENKFNPLKFGPLDRRTKSLMHVEENKYVPMLDFDYTDDYMHSAIGSANVRHAGEAIDAVKRLARDHPESLWDLYLTAGGTRAFNVGKRQGASPLSALGSKFLDDPAVDRWYSGFSKDRNLFATRITPKGERAEDFVAQRVGRYGTGKENPAARGLIREMHDNYITQYLKKYGLKDERFAKGFLEEFEKQLRSVSTQQQREMLKFLDL